MKETRILFASGGTGGHLYPAIAMAEEIREQNPEWRIIFVGKKGGFEQEKVTEAGYEFFGIRAKGWSRKKMGENLSLPFVLTLTVAHLLLWMLFNRPKAVFGTGGYVSAPTLLTARLLGIPIAIQEQNAFPGWVTRWACNVAKKVFLAYPEAQKYLSKTSYKKIQILGMPIRPIANFRKEDLIMRYGLSAEKPVFVIFGGSQGSRTLNQWMGKIAGPVIEQTGAQVIWQTGVTEWQMRHLRPNGEIPGVKILPYLDPIYDYLAMADLVLCRAGSSTLAEITAFGIPAIMVPYPHATDNHQEKNARYLEKAGAGICVLENEITDEGISQKVLDILQNRKKREEMSRASKSLGRPNAARETAREFIKMVVTK